MLGPHPVVMTPRLFRPATPRSHAHLPQRSISPRLRAVALLQLLARAVGLVHHPRARVVAVQIAVGVGMVCQVGLLLTAAYLIDLAVSLMELWAELARKHLELTL